MHVDQHRGSASFDDKTTHLNSPKPYGLIHCMGTVYTCLYMYTSPVELVCVSPEMYISIPVLQSIQLAN